MAVTEDEIKEGRRLREVVATPDNIQQPADTGAEVRECLHVFMVELHAFRFRGRVPS